jgi:hypothetical protein
MQDDLCTYEDITVDVWILTFKISKSLHSISKAPIVDSGHKHVVWNE